MTDSTRLNGGINDQLAEKHDRFPPPLHIPYVGRRLWKELLDSLPIDWFITADLPMLELYCTAYAEYLDYRKRAIDSGEVYEDEKGVLRINPYWLMAEKQKNFMMQLSTKLKFTVKSRDGDTLSPTRDKAIKEETKKRVGRRNGLMYIKGGKDNHPVA